MNIQEQSITFNKQQLILNNQRTIFWRDQNSLILSDLHLGKAAHFRKHGIAIPAEASTADLHRLAALIAHYRAAQVIVVGDLIHAGINQEVQALQQLRAAYPDLQIQLVKGNHDRQSAGLAEQFGIHCHDDLLEIEQICFEHQPRPSATSFRISGHLHPGISITIPPRRQLRLPCFWISEHQIILPAFSRFTGLDSRQMPLEYRCYAVLEDSLLPINTR